MELGTQPSSRDTLTSPAVHLLPEGGSIPQPLYQREDAGLTEESPAGNTNPGHSAAEHSSVTLHPKIVSVHLRNTGYRDCKETNTKRGVPGTRDTMCRIRQKKERTDKVGKNRKIGTEATREKKISCSNINKTVYRDKLKTPVPEVGGKRRAGNTSHEHCIL